MGKSLSYMTIAELLQQYKSSLLKIYDAAEVRAIVRLVFEKTLQVDALRVEMNRYLLLTTHQQSVLEKYLERLMHHEPVQYVLGEAEFMGMVFKVNSHVLIPRPETEDLVRWIVDSAGKDFTGNVLDIGTGSGCIAIGLKKNLESANVAACDVCTDALYTATENALNNECEIDFFRCDVLVENLPAKYDVIVSNPPYIPMNEKDTLAKHVADFEPHQALFTPASDAMIFYEHIAELALQHLNPSGKIFFECHTDKTAEVVAILQSKGFQYVEMRKDVFGKNRMVGAVTLS